MRVRRLTRPLVLGACVCASLALPAASAASDTEMTIFEAPRELLKSPDSVRQATLDEIDALGADTVRLLLTWKRVAPSANSSSKPDLDTSQPTAYLGYKLAPYDAAIAEARQRGLRVLLTVSGPVPRWATESGHSFTVFPKPNEYYDFVKAMGRRYAGQVDMWSIWNEPNYGVFLGPQRVKGAPRAGTLYRQLYLAGHRALVDSGHGSDTILIGETAPLGTRRGLAPLDFMRQTLCLNRRYMPIGRCAELPASGWAHHPYDIRQTPLTKPPGRDDVTIGVLQRLTTALRRAGKAGALPARLPAYLTEYGIQTLPDPRIGVPLETQARSLARAEDVAYSNQGVAAFDQYLMRDDPPNHTGLPYGGFESGIRQSDGLPKPSYDGFRTPLAVFRSPTQGLSFWGYVRPHHRHGLTEPIEWGKHANARCPTRDSGAAAYQGAELPLPAPRYRPPTSLLYTWNVVRAHPTQKVEIQYLPKRSSRWSKLVDVRTDRAGYFGAEVADPGGASAFRDCWISPDGATYLGPPSRP